MASVTLLPQSRPLTRHDLVVMPDDGHRYELIDGTLLVTPAPSRRHQSAQMALVAGLLAMCPPHMKVLVAPVDVVMAEDTVVQPDVLVVDAAEFSDEARPVRPLLVVEILSPSTRLIDLNLKRARYEQARCPSYWVLDPDTPSLTAWELLGGSYVQAATASGEERFSVSQPFAIRLVPARLLG